VLAAHEGALVVRTSAFFGPWDRYNFVFTTLAALAAGRRVEASRDVVSPTYVPDLVHEVLNLLVDGSTGLWHLANAGAMSWYDLALAAAARAGFDERLVAAVGEGEPLSTALTSERGVLLPSLQGAIDRFFPDSEIDWSDRALHFAAE
jgi:dTDP-4-dehydrorhamnose reductase